MSVARSGSYGSLPTSTVPGREPPAASNRSGAPTIGTNPGTVHSEAGYSRAATTTTQGGALSTDGAGADSTFSSPSESQHSLTTTLTTIQSNGAAQSLQYASGSANPNIHGSLNNSNPVHFSHQFPVSPATSNATTMSAIPRHMTDAIPVSYNAATAGGLLTDNASIITLASSSKRRRRSMDTDASVRALAPNSVYGGSRESLPLSVLSGNADAAPPSDRVYFASQSRPSIGGLASAERASVYSAQGVSSERNSYYSYKPKDLADAKSLRSITNMDARSLNADAKSLGGDVGSLRNYESSIQSGKAGHNRNDSIPGSVNGPPGGSRHLSGTLSRRSSDWQRLDAEGIEDDDKQSVDEHDFDSTHEARTASAGGPVSETK